MPAYVALVRAIGPVTHAKMRMAALRDACEDLGLTDVTTFGNTGNVLFRSRKGPAAARALVEEAVNGFGLDNEVFVRTHAQMAEVVAADPFPEAAADRPAALGVCSFHEAPDWTGIRAWDGPERLAIVGPHLVVDYPAGITTSRFRIEKLAGASMTMRNWRMFANICHLLAEL